MKLPRENLPFEVASLILTTFCLSFVVYKSQECLEKYFKHLQSSTVSIEDALKYDYPAVSICLNDLDSFYEPTLKKCNLSSDEYRGHDKWVGNGTEDFCKDPLALYEEMTKDPFKSIVSAVSVNYEYNLTTYATKDDKGNGRCYEFELPKNTKIAQLEFWFLNHAYVYIHSPGSFYGTDYKGLQVLIGKEIAIDIMHEVFEVLDFDGQPCKKYPEGRDKCLDDKIHELSMEELGCTSPYGQNKSNICTRVEKSSKAFSIFEDLTQCNLTEANKYCPKSCAYQILSLDKTYENSPDNKTQGHLYLRFQNFIKVSKSHFEYGWLELMAEVGGYVGLFLGVSINQTLSRMRQVFRFFARK